MADHTDIAYSHAGASREVTMHADAGKVTKLQAPPWADTALVRFFQASTSPPTTPTDTSGWVGDGSGTAGQLIGVDALHVKSGEALVMERQDVGGAWIFDLACETGSGIAQIRYERTGG